MPWTCEHICLGVSAGVSAILAVYVCAPCVSHVWAVSRCFLGGFPVCLGLCRPCNQWACNPAWKVL